MVIKITAFDPPRYYLYKSFVANATTDSQQTFETEKKALTSSPDRIEFQGNRKAFWLVHTQVWA
jgi:hypothetical protein